MYVVKMQACTAASDDVARYNKLLPFLEHIIKLVNLILKLSSRSIAVFAVSQSCIILDATRSLTSS